MKWEGVSTGTDRIYAAYTPVGHHVSLALRCSSLKAYFEDTNPKAAKKAGTRKSGDIVQRFTAVAEASNFAQGSFGESVT